MGKRLIRNLFSSGLQAIALQVLGVGFFYLTSLYLSKEDLGIISWANAVAAMLAIVMSLGMEQVVVRRIAAGGGSSWPAAAYFFHAVCTSAVTILALFLISMLVGEQGGTHNILLLFFAVQAMVFVTVPLKQYLNAREQFTPYGVIAIISNTAKLLIVWYSSLNQQLTINQVGGILIGCTFFEFVALIIYIRSATGFRFAFRFSAYTKLVKESLPQYLSVLFDTGLSRIDWILLGLLSTMAITADYSFAFRAFEMCRLPLFIIGPVIFPVFARAMLGGKGLSDEMKGNLKMLFAIITFCATLLPLVLNIIWTPWVGAITGNKYGASNALVFCILSLCLPLQFIINFFWTICFSSKYYRQVTTIIIVSSVANLLLNVLLIPMYAGLGAAFAYMGAAIVQVLFYILLLRKKVTVFPVTPLIYFSVFALISFWCSRQAGTNVFLQIFTAIFVYVLLSVCSGTIRKTHYRLLAGYIKG